jgi:hypothetical protein
MFSISSYFEQVTSPDINMLFNRYYKGKIICWKGFVVNVLQNSLVICPTLNSSNSLILLHNFREKYDRFINEIEFCGSLEKIGEKDFVVELKAVTFDTHLADPLISFAKINSVFGFENRNSDNIFFQRMWLNRSILLYGKFKSPFKSYFSYYNIKFIVVNFPDVLVELLVKREDQELIGKILSLNENGFFLLLCVFIFIS